MIEKDKLGKTMFEGTLFKLKQSPMVDTVLQNVTDDFSRYEQYLIVPKKEEYCKDICNAIQYAEISSTDVFEFPWHVEIQIKRFYEQQKQ